MLNVITLIGRLTKDPEVKKAADETKFATFSLAINQGKDDYVEFVDCVGGTHLTETISKWVRKGDKIVVTGKFSNRKFNRKDGSIGVQARILVDNIEFVDVLAFNNSNEDPFGEEKVEEKEKPAPKPSTRRR